MRVYSHDFDLTPGHIWLNAASEGPLLKVSAQALQEAVAWKSAPQKLTMAKFQQVPLELKQSIARLTGLPFEDIILGNSATYGMHLLANGLPWEKGDEIILMRNDFPTDILPWLHLKNKGVLVHQLKSVGPVLTPEEVEAAISAKTKVICLPYIHTFSGWPLKIAAIGKLCRSRGILFVVNMSQALGAMEIDIPSLPVDAIVCAGYKWLLGPYGTGFCWVRPQLREQLQYPQAYWISLMDECSLEGTDELVLKDDHSARRYDVFATANFFNFVPWRAGLDYLLEVGIKNINRHIMALVNHFINGLDRKQYGFISPIGTEAGNIIVITHLEESRNRGIFDYLKEQGLYLAFWKGQLRVSPHIYNTVEDMEKLLTALNTYGTK